MNKACHFRKEQSRTDLFLNPQDFSFVQSCASKLYGTQVTRIKERQPLSCQYFWLASSSLPRGSCQTALRRFLSFRKLMPLLLSNTAFDMKDPFFLLFLLPRNNAFLLTHSFKACFSCMLEFILFFFLGVSTCAENLFLLKMPLNQILTRILKCRL